MVRILRTDSGNPDFVALVKLLDADLAVRDGIDHSFYAQFNKINRLNHVIVAYENEVPVGCGALKEYEPNAMEVKRMYVVPASRGQGIATAVLTALENWATELSYRKCVLETGKKQPEAIALYQSRGYQIISNYGQYKDVENSVCFEKQLS